MNNPHEFNEPITLLRDCEATLIPEGASITLREGTAVYVTQALGGSVTVNIDGNLARIPPQSVDAIGLEVETLHAESGAPSGDGTVDEALIWDQMRTCYDPEIPINVVDLGLIYNVEVDEGKVHVDMTLTAAGCSMGPMIAQQAEVAIAEIENIQDVEVEMVFDPPWSPEMITEDGKKLLGID